MPLEHLALDSFDVPSEGVRDKTLILKHDGILWMRLPGASEGRFQLSISSGENVLVTASDEASVKIAAGKYSFTVEPTEVQAGASPPKGLVFFQVRYLEEVDCDPEVARFGLYPFEGTVDVTPIPDLNQDGDADYSATYAISPTQVATRLSIARPFPECARTVLDVIGHVVPSNEFRGGWRRIYQLTREVVPEGAPFEIKRRFGFSWSVTRWLDFDAPSDSYLPSDAPIRCERTDGVQRVYAETGPNPRASLILDDQCARFFGQSPNPVPDR